MSSSVQKSTTAPSGGFDWRGMVSSKLFLLGLAFLLLTLFDEFFLLVGMVFLILAFTSRLDRATSKGSEGTDSSAGAEAGTSRPDSTES